jgi:outer membrane lipoprotein-sorting protein
MIWRAWLALAAAAATASCAASLLTLPPSTGAAAPDAANALAEALITCRGIRTLTAQVVVAGRVNGQRIRARLQVGLAQPASAYIEAPAPFGSPVFIFAAENDEATLLLPRDRRVLEHGRPADVLEAIAGVPLAPAGLRATLTGCLLDDAAQGPATQPDARWRVFPGNEEAYVHRDRETDPWHLLVVMHQNPGPAWRAEYRDFVSNLPRSIHLISTPPSRFDLQLTLSDVELNVPIGPETFRVQIPAGTTPLTIEELRSGGPLAERSRKADE